MKQWTTLFLILLFSLVSGNSQTINTDRFFEKSDSLHQLKFITSSAFALSSYSAFSYGLYHAWYKQYDQTNFHFFNDLNAWGNMDKAGHMYTAYFQGLLGYKGAKWTGLSDNYSILTGIVMGTVFQGTIELMDGFAAEWGYSLPDFVANTLGTVIFAGQQYFWEEQRIRLKFSFYPVDYPNLLMQSTDLTLNSPLSERINKVYGEGLLNRILKDYNGQTYWASINMGSFLPNSYTFPKWLNIAIGYSVDNYFGAYENSWIEQDREFMLDPSSFPRLQQYYLSLDLDLSRVRTKSAFFNTILDIFDIFKCPAPAIGINNRGNLEFHLFYF